MHTVLWNSLDREGHDACRISKASSGWHVEGSAVFSHHDNDVASLSYRLECDDAWQSCAALVKGWVGSRNMEVSIARQANGHWLINGLHDASLDGLADIDLGFTPASNTNALRRLNLKEMQAGTSVAVWLDTEDWCVKSLHQEYVRTGRNMYDYASPRHGYRATLEVTDFGIVVEYPGLWKMCRLAQS